MRVLRGQEKKQLLSRMTAEKYRQPFLGDDDHPQPTAPDI